MKQLMIGGERKRFTIRILLCLVLWPCSVLGDIEIIDFAGRTVTLDKPAQRIIALAPHIVENAFSAGAGSKLVGVVSYSNFPAAANTIPEVGTYKTVNLEAIVTLQPDLILLWSSGNGMKTLNALEDLGLQVYVSEPRELADIATTIRHIAKLAGTEQQGNSEAADIENQFDTLTQRYSHQSPVSVFYQVWNEPLQTLNGDHLISKVINLCGGVNSFADAAFLAPRIGVESVLTRNPDAIIASGMGTARPEWLDEWKAYPSLRAIQANTLFFVAPDHIQRPTARILLGASTLCEQLAIARKRLAS
ncbi:MAG: cobalamin-binding protein [Halioglobus sp.]